MKKVIDEVNDDDFVKVNRVNTSTPNKAKDRVTDEAKLEDGAQMDRVITSKPRLVHVKPSALKSNKEDKCLN